MRPLPPAADSSVAPSRDRPASTRQRQLAAVLRMQRLEDVAERLLAGCTPSRAAVSSMPGASWRRAFIRRSTPLSRAAEPTAPGRSPVAQFARRDRRTPRRAAAGCPRAIAPSARRRGRRASPASRSGPPSRDRDLRLRARRPRRPVLAVDEGAFEREIDEAGDQLALPDRDLAQHQRHARGRLECRRASRGRACRRGRSC